MTKDGGHVLVSVMSLVGTITHYLPMVLDLVRRDGAAKSDESCAPASCPKKADYGHLPMKLFRWSELEALLSRHGTIVAASAAGLLPGAQPTSRSSERSWRAPSLRSRRSPEPSHCGEHILAVLRKDA